MHPGQLAISSATVRELVDAQFPQWRALAIKPADSAGTVNAIFRVGNHLAAESARNVVPTVHRALASAALHCPSLWGARSLPGL